MEIFGSMNSMGGGGGVYKASCFLINTWHLGGTSINQTPCIGQTAKSQLYYSWLLLYFKIGRPVVSSQKFDSFERTFPSCGSDPTPRTIQFSLKRRPKPQALFAQLMTNSFYNMKFIWVSLSISLCLILTFTILVAAGRVHSISKDSVLMARGPVPPSSASSCTYIGGDDGADHSPCLTTPTTPP